MRKDLSQHFTASENFHAAVKSVAVEKKIEINELVEKVLLRDEKIKAAYDRIEGAQQ